METHSNSQKAFYEAEKLDAIVIDFGWYFTTLKKSKTSIFLCAIMALIIGTLIAFTKPDIYKTATVLTNATDNLKTSGNPFPSQISGLANMVGLNIGGNGSSTYNTITILESKSFIISFIKDENIKPIIFDERWDKENSEWKSAGIVDSLKNTFKGFLMGPDYEVTYEPSDLEAYERFSRRNMEVEFDIEKDQITLSIYAETPEYCIQWANHLIAKFNNHARTQEQEEAMKSLELLERELGETSISEIQQILFQLIEANKKKLLLAKVKEEYALKTLDSAFLPEIPISPNRALIIIVFGILGMIAAIIAVILYYAFKNKSTD